MTFHFLAILAGIAILVIATRLVSRALVAIAGALGVSRFIIAFFLVAFSTTIPELAVGVSAALQGIPSLALGNAFGSNVVNLTLIAGFVSFFSRKKIDLSAEITKRQGMWMFFVASLPFFLILDGTLSRFDGAVLLAGFSVYCARLAREKKIVLSEAEAGMPRTASERRWLMSLAKGILRRDRTLFGAIGMFVLGVALLVGGSHLTVEAAKAVVTALGVSPFLIGILLVAVGTSLPEFAFGIRAVANKEPELSLGNVLGSVAINSSWILGIVSLISPITPAVLTSAVISGGFMIAVFAIFFYLMHRGGGAQSQRRSDSDDPLRRICCSSTRAWHPVARLRIAT